MNVDRDGAAKDNRGAWHKTIRNLLIAFTLYVLSIGPAWWISAKLEPNHVGTGAKILTAVYRPLESGLSLAGAGEWLSAYLHLFFDFHEQEIVQILKDLNDWNPQSVQQLNNDFTGLIIDNGEIGAMVARHERDAKQIGYTLYWNEQESRYLARPIRSSAR